MMARLQAMKPIPLRFSLAVLCALALIPSARAAVGLSVSPANITNDFVGKITLTITDSSAGQTVRVERFSDLNGNGVVNAPADRVFRSFTVTDGQLPIIGGVRNLNVPGDDDGAVNGQIRVDLDSPGIDNVLGTGAGSFIYRVSDSLNSFPPVTQTFAVAQKLFAQGIRGRVTAAVGGSPLAGAFVVLLNANGIGMGGTFADAAGDYELQTPPGDYLIVALYNGYLGDFSAGSATVVTTQFTTKNLALATGAFTLSGRVTDATSGAGIAGVLMFGDSTNNLFSTATTDTDGNYSFVVSASQWQVEVNESGLTQLGYLRPEKLITNITSASAANVNFATLKATALIYGTVKDNLNNPVNGVVTRAEDQGNLYESQGRSFAPNASYTLGVLAGTWSVGVEPDTLPAGYTTGTGTNVTLNAGQAVQANLILSAVTARLRGQIRDDSGAPIPNMTIVVQKYPINPSGAGSSYPTTDANGNFDVGVYAGTWTIALECVEANDRSLVNQHFDYLVVDSVDQNGLVLTFPRSTGVITGTVKDTLNNPIPGVELDANITGNGTPYNSGCVATDANGTYTIRVLNNSSWSVSVRNSDLNARGFNGVSSQIVAVSGGSGGANFVASQFKVTILSSPGQIQTQGFNLSVAVEPGRNYRLQASTNLTFWIDLTSFTGGGGPFPYLDGEATTRDRRFYRVVSP